MIKRIKMSAIIDRVVNSCSEVHRNWASKTARQVVQLKGTWLDILSDLNERRSSKPYPPLTSTRWSRYCSVSIYMTQSRTLRGSKTTKETICCIGRPTITLLESVSILSTTSSSAWPSTWRLRLWSATISKVLINSVQMLSLNSSKRSGRRLHLGSTHLQRQSKGFTLFTLLASTVTSSWLSFSCVTKLITRLRQVRGLICYTWLLKAIKPTAWLISGQRVSRSSRRTRREAHRCTGPVVLALTLPRITCNRGASM